MHRYLVTFTNGATATVVTQDIIEAAYLAARDTVMRVEQIQKIELLESFDWIQYFFRP